jgi:glycosyltransferase involved in cell wall biosynthesis
MPIERDVVYIPTMNRIDNLRIIIPKWLDQEFQVRLVMERSEWKAHVTMKKQEGWDSSVYLLPAPLSGRGIGYARNYCVQHAKNTALEAIIMSDDDLYVHTNSDAFELIEAACEPGVLGVGATRSLHDRFTGGAISANSGVILCPGGWGLQLFGLNVRMALACGNFDRRLHSFGEDAELARQGIKNGIPWLAHCDVTCVQIGKRYDAGGISTRYRTPESRSDGERECMDIIHKMWPEYTNAPDKKPRVAWQKLLDRYIPDWMEASAIHGGSLDKLNRPEE